jgi:uncharacterized membrane protein HdeD (DUF308 family)
MNTTLLHLLGKNWWVLLLRGICGIAFGLLAFAWPGITLLTLILLYGVFVGAEGFLEIIAAIRGGTVAPRWWLAIAGIIALAASAVTFLAPGITTLVLLYIIAAWAVVHGIFEVIGAIQLRKLISNEWLLVFSGLLSVAFGLCVLIWPGAGALSLIWLIAAYAIVAGVLCVGLSFRLKKHQAV